MKKLILSLFVLNLFCCTVYAQERSILNNTPTPATPTPAIAEPAAQTAVSSPAVNVQAAPAATVCQSGSCNKKVTYRGRHNIAPNAVPTGVEVARCETCTDVCCNKVTTKTVQGVEICTPACPCKEDVRTSLNGKRKVYDYGKYEVVVTDRADSVDVRYRKRILSR